MAKIYLLIVVIAISIIPITMTKGMLVGGWSDVPNKNSTSFLKLLDFATAKIASRSNCAYRMRPIEVISAKKQIVSGVKYDIWFKVGATECKRNVQYSEEVLKKCDFLPSEPVQICHATVWDQPWEKNNAIKLLKSSCEDESVKKSLKFLYDKVYAIV